MVATGTGESHAENVPVGFLGGDWLSGNPTGFATLRTQENASGGVSCSGWAGMGVLGLKFPDLGVKQSPNGVLLFMHQ